MARARVAGQYLQTLIFNPRLIVVGVGFGCAMLYGDRPRDPETSISMGDPMNLAPLDYFMLDDRTKGIPGGTAPFALKEIAAKGWNVLGGDLPLPLAVIKQSVLAANGRWMRDFLARSGAVIAPHGKTTMSPHLFARQFADGAWALTVATVGQLQVARRYGVSRLVLANQLVGRQEIRYVLDELARDADFELHVLVDSVAGVELLADAVAARGLARPLDLLLEGGVAGRRTGCRSLADALAVARAVAAAPGLALRGVEGFEGLIHSRDEADTEARVVAFLDFLVEIARALAAEDLFAPGPVILSAGGSAFYDLVIARFGRAGLDREVRVVTRSGCYITHDSTQYRHAFERIVARTPEAAAGAPGAPKLDAAIELWSYVQSRPEPTRALATFGRRDCSFDAGLPVPRGWARPGVDATPRPLGDDHGVVEVNDQHAFIDLPARSPLAVGDMIACGISHPCTTFDKWRVLYLVDDDYDIVGALPTFF